MEKEQQCPIAVETIENVLGRSEIFLRTPPRPEGGKDVSLRELLNTKCQTMECILKLSFTITFYHYPFIIIVHLIC